MEPGGTHDPGQPMDIGHVLSLFRHEVRTLVDEGESLEALDGVTRRTFVGGAIHQVTAYDLRAEAADAVIRREATRAADLGVELEWKVFSFDTPSDLLPRLTGAGFVVGEREAMVVFDTQSGLLDAGADRVKDVRTVRSDTKFHDFREVSEAVFGKDYQLTTNEVREALSRGREDVLAYVGYESGRPVAAARLYTARQSRFAGLYGGGTLREHRGKGFYRALVFARARDAARIGARYLVVDALPTSLPILLRLGFVHLADTWPCLLRPKTR